MSFKLMAANANSIVLIHLSADMVSLANTLTAYQHHSGALKKAVVFTGFATNVQNEQFLHQLHYLNINTLYVVQSENPVQQIGMFPLCYLFKTEQRFAADITLHNFSNSALLIIGSNAGLNARLAALFGGKTHHTTMHINLNSVDTNIAYFKKLMPATTKICAMIKANAYGHGDVVLAQHLQRKGIDYLSVALTDEAVNLRRNGITMPILVMNPEPEGLPVIIDYGLEPSIAGFDNLHNFINVHSLKKQTAYPVHIKLDTGMHRSGFMAHEIEALIQLLKNNPQIQVKGVFSHLSGSDEATFDDYTQYQIQQFTQMANNMQEQLNVHFIRHMLNSAAVERFTNSAFDMVRIGMGMFGVSSINTPDLIPAATLKTRITQLKLVPGGQTVGYSRKGKTITDTLIATVPIGYGDGYSRAFSNGVGSMLVNGTPAKIIGNVCMDMSMLDVTGLACKPGDEVIIFGPAHPAQQLASAINTITYEIFTHVAHRVKRVYFG